MNKSDRSYMKRATKICQEHKWSVKPYLGFLARFFSSAGTEVSGSYSKTVDQFEENEKKELVEDFMKYVSLSLK